MLKEEYIVQNEYKHLRINLKDKFVLSASVNNAKVEYDGENKMRISATLEGHKIIDTGWVYVQEGYTYEIVEDTIIHKVSMTLAELKFAYNLTIKAHNDSLKLSDTERDMLNRLIVNFGYFVRKRNNNG